MTRSTKQDAAIMFRCTGNERDLIKLAAARAHLTVSTWIRSVCLQAAEKAVKGGKP